MFVNVKKKQKKHTEGHRRPEFQVDLPPLLPKLQLGLFHFLFFFSVLSSESHLFLKRGLFLHIYIYILSVFPPLSYSCLFISFLLSCFVSLSSSLLRWKEWVASAQCLVCCLLFVVCCRLFFLLIPALPFVCLFVFERTE